MSRYNMHYSAPHAPSTENAGVFNPIKVDRHDERDSQSGSDDGYSLYPEVSKNETDPDEESHSLTSQTLNADGTPKRPMNAFMIFARRRRPQVSAENQSMRTGEISKILSKEWNAMPAPDKQFYLDQAKYLKETFNSKYPDYIYRRRPNNSRKRRRTDGTSRPTDNPIPSDSLDDLVGANDLGECSPTDAEEALIEHSPLDVHYSRSSHDVSQGYGEHAKYPSQSRSSAYPYPPSDVSYRVSPHDSRLSYPAGGSDRHPPQDLNHPATSSATLRLPPSTHNSHPYPYLSPHSHSPSNTLYSHDQNDGPRQWESRLEQSRGPSTWSAGNERPLAPLGQKTASYASPSSQGAWQTSPQALSGPSPTGSSTSTGYPFPTLTSPFYPAPAQLQGSYSGSSSGSPTSPTNSQPQAHYDHSGSMQTGHMSHPRDYEDRRYGPSPSLAAMNVYPPTSGRDSLLYAQGSSLPRGLPPVQSISNYSTTQNLAHTLLPPARTNSPTNYWSSDKVDGL